MSTTAQLKQLALKYLPEAACRTLRRVHYRQALRNYDRAGEPDLEGCERLIARGDTVLDIGANIGVYSRFCSEFVGPEGQVIALEPIPETFSYLESNIRSLGLRNVRCLNVAASDHDSEQDRMSVPEYETGGNNLYCASLSATGNVSVKTARLDSLFPELCPQFIKCDVEGHEAACVAGASNLIARCRPKFLVEVTDGSVFAQFAALGYKAFWFDASGFRPYDPDVKRVNYFFLPQ